LDLTLLFRVSIYVLTALAGCMLAYAEGALLPAISIPLAALAFFFNEHWKVLRIPVVLANLLGLAAFIFAGNELFTGGIEARLLSGAHLLVYLTWVVLFQKKDAAGYWWMIALGLLQVAVGSVLTSAGWYGMFLTCYVFFGIWTLSLFSFYRAETANRKFYAVDSILRLQELRASVLQQNIGFSFQDTATTEGQKHAVEFHSVRIPSMARGSMQTDPGKKWATLRFATGTISIATISILIGLMFFLLIPRLWIGNRNFLNDDDDAPLARHASLTGFTEQVTLGEFGEILESTEPVLEIRLFDHLTGEELDVEQHAAQMGYSGEPVFRGSVLKTYQNGRWSAGRFYRGSPRLPTQVGRNVIRQEIRLEPIGTRFLFGLHPILGCRAEEPNIHFFRNILSGVIITDHKRARPRREPFSYQAFTPKLSRAQNSPLEQPVTNTELAVYLRTGYLKECLEIPGNLQRLTEFSKSKVDSSEENQTIARIDQARKLESYLRDSGEFSYSLNLSIQDASIDPIEDFLFNRKTGHCEYYASTLAMMLRAVDIPSRVVSGFKGGDKSILTGAYHVQQRHAHTWVEAFIDDSWVLLDATPAGERSESVESMAPNIRSWQQLKDALTKFWSSYVVTINYRQQQNEIYEPLRESLQESRSKIEKTLGPLGKPAKYVIEFLTSPKRLLSIDGAIFVSSVLLFSFLLVWGTKKLIRMLRLLRGKIQKSAQARAGKRVEFYERFKKIVSEHGFNKEFPQTQREFAQQVHTGLCNDWSESSVAQLPEELVELYYTVRFGEKHLDRLTIDQINEQLTEWEKKLVAANGIEKLA